MSTILGTLQESELKTLLALRTGSLRAFVQRRIPARFQHLIDVDDVLQEIWIVAFRTVRSFRQNRPDAFERWLTTIARSTLAQVLRVARGFGRDGNGRFVHGDGQRGTSSSHVFAHLRAPQVSPSREFHQRETARVVGKHIERLEPARRQAVELRYIAGLSLKETARCMGKTPAAVNSLLFKAKLQLKRRLGTAADWFSDAPSSEPADADQTHPRRR